MFELGKTDHWWEIAKRHPSLSNHPNTLKPLGYAHIVNIIESFEPRTVLEVGHGAMSFIFKLFSDKVEMWGLDDVIEDSSVYEEDLKNVRLWNPNVKFVSGLLGNFVKELPDNYFDLVYSVSVIEHIPHEMLPKVFEDTYRILKPGGIVSHSYDVYYKQSTKEVFDAYEHVNLKWLKPRSTMNVFWEDWLEKPDNNRMEELFEKIVFENPMEVAEKYMWQQERSARSSPINFVTVLTAARKPFSENGNTASTPKSSIKITDDFDGYTFSKRSHMNAFLQEGYDKIVYGREIDIDYSDVKVYQNLLTYSYIKNNLNPGSRILEIGNTVSPVTHSVSKEYDCSILPVTAGSDKGNFSESNLKVAEGDMSNINEAVESNSFDLIYSVSSLGQEKDGSVEEYDKKLAGIKRLLKKDGLAILNFTALSKDPVVWTPDILKHFFSSGNPKNKEVMALKMLVDEDLFVMSEKFYADNWMKATNRPYSQFGKPLSISIFINSD